MEEDYRKMKQGKERLYLEERSLVDMALKLISLTNIICCSGTVILSRSREGAGEYYVQKGSFSGFRNMKRLGIHLGLYKGPKGLTYAFYGYEKIKKTFWFLGSFSV